MASTATPYGMRPIKMIGSQAFPAAMREVPMTTNSANAVYMGCGIAINSGSAVCLAATPTTTRSTSTPVGVCIGVEYVDPVNHQLMFSQYLPANAVNSGYTNIKIKVVDDPDAMFLIQANGSVTAAQRGLNAALASVTSGDTMYGKSTMTLDAATIATTATLAVRIVDFYDAPGSAVGDAYTDVIVKWNQGVHAYQNATGG
jgi:hypothetical protein